MKKIILLIPFAFFLIGNCFGQKSFFLKRVTGTHTHSLYTFTPNEPCPDNEALYQYRTNSPAFVENLSNTTSYTAEPRIITNTTGIFSLFERITYTFWTYLGDGGPGGGFGDEGGSNCQGNVSTINGSEVIVTIEVAPVKSNTSFPQFLCIDSPTDSQLNVFQYISYSGNPGRILWTIDECNNCIINNWSNTAKIDISKISFGPNTLRARVFYENGSVELTWNFIAGGTQGLTVTPSKTNIVIGEPITFTSNATEATTISWAFGDGFTSNQRIPTHYYYTPGSKNISLTSTDTYGCSGTKVFYNLITVADYEVITADPILNYRKGYKVFPNPVKDVVYFETQQSGPLRLVLYNISGETLFELDSEIEKGETISIRTDNFPSGIYLLRVTNLQLSETFKLVKK